MTCILTARMGLVGRAGTGKLLPFLPGESTSWPETGQLPDVLLSGLFLLTCFDQGRWLTAAHSQGMSVPSTKSIKTLDVM